MELLTIYLDNLKRLTDEERKIIWNFIKSNMPTPIESEFRAKNFKAVVEEKD